MSRSEQANLKRSLHRSVYVEEGQGERRLVKRFHSADRLGRLFDRRRARREARMLAALAERGIRVPRARGVRSGDPGWELVLEYVEGAPALLDLFRGRAPWPQPPEQVARELGRTAARALLAGLEHDDLHAGNVLIDGKGDPWLVDVAHARLRRDGIPERIHQELIRWTAEAREHATIGFRQRFLLAFFRELPAGVRAAMSGERNNLGALARNLEESGRSHRRNVLAAEAEKWTRDSSAARTIHKGPHRGWSRRDFEEDAIDPLLARLPSDPRTAANALAWTVLAGDASPRDRTTTLAVCWGPWSQLLARWSTLARLEMHALPAARPLLLLRRPHPLLAVQLPAGARPLPRAGAASARASMEELAALGRLLGTLHDRRYRGPLEDCWLAESSPVQAVLLPVRELATLGKDPAELVLDCEQFLRSLEATTWPARAALLEGYSRSFRGARLEGTKLVQVMSHA